MSHLKRRGFTAMLGASLAAPAIMRAARADAPVKVGFRLSRPGG